MYERKYASQNASSTLNSSRRKGDAFYSMIRRLLELQQVHVFEEPQGFDLLLATKVLEKIYSSINGDGAAFLWIRSRDFIRSESRWKIHATRIIDWDWMQIQSGGDKTPVFCSFFRNSFTCNFDRESCNIKLLKSRYYVHKWEGFSTTLVYFNHCKRYFAITFVC